MADFSDRLHRVIPGGAHTYSRGDDQYPANAPEILARGEGAYVYDPAGRRYLDYGMGLRAVTLGYADPRVNAAAIAQIERGVNLTRPSLVELEAAEAIVDLIPAAVHFKYKVSGTYLGQPYSVVVNDVATYISGVLTEGIGQLGALTYVTGGTFGIGDTEIDT